MPNHNATTDAVPRIVPRRSSSLLRCPCGREISDDDVAACPAGADNIVVAVIMHAVCYRWAQWIFEGRQARLARSRGGAS